MMSPDQGRSHDRGKQRLSPAELKIAEALKMLESLAPSKLEDSAMESALLGALISKSRAVQKIGTEEKQYLIYTDYSDSSETVVFVHDPLERSRHKYIIASAYGPLGNEHSVIICAPMAWTPMHHDLLTRVWAATGALYVCSGGGYVDLSADNQIDVNGQSGDYGEGNHARALGAFQRAVRNSAQSNDSH